MLALRKEVLEQWLCGGKSQVQHFLSVSGKDLYLCVTGMEIAWGQGSGLGQGTLHNEHRASSVLGVFG